MKEKKQKALNKSEFLKTLVQESLSGDKAQDIIIIDMRGKSDVADFMVIASGSSNRHVAALASKVMEKMNKAGFGTYGAEGYPDCDWVLVDNPYVVVHIMKPEIRGYYNLEKMWQADFSNTEKEAEFA